MVNVLDTRDGRKFMFDGIRIKAPRRSFQQHVCRMIGELPAGTQNQHRDGE